MQLQELISHHFEEANIPTTWFPQSVSHTYERGCMRSGRSTQLIIPLPGQGWNRIRVETEIEPVGGAVVDCGDGVVTMALKVKEGAYVRHCAVRHATVLAESFKRVPDKPGVRLVVFEFEPSRMRGSVDGEEFITATNPAPQPITGSIQLLFWCDCFVHSIRILGGEPLVTPLNPPAPRRQQDFFLDMAVDFYDDIGELDDDPTANPDEFLKYSRAMYDEFFAQLARCGVRRVAWNYHDRIAGDKMVITDERDIGDNFELAVELAHKHGLQILGTIKPYESEYFARYDKAQPGMLMSRKPGAWGESEAKVVQRIDLVKEDDRPCAFAVSDITLLVSDDNKRYIPYNRPIQRDEVIEDYPLYEHTSSGGRKTSRTRRSRVMRFSGLEIPHKYLALSVPSRQGSFANTLLNLVHVFGENGEDRRYSYGLAANAAAADVAQVGLNGAIAFGGRSGVSTAHLGLELMNEPCVFDTHQGLLGLRRSKTQYADGLGSAAYPQVRDWWLSWVRAILEAGADGVEIRRTNHTSPFTWAEFGFEQPVRDEFLQRTGLDIWKTDDFDHALWRRIRGEGYTEFCRGARAITRRAGKTLGLHIDVVMDVEPEHSAAMDMHWDWRTWINEGLADYVLLKDIWPSKRFAQEIISVARPKGIDVVVSLYSLSQSRWKEPESIQIMDGRIRAVRDGGCDGFQYYGSSSLLRGIPGRQRVVIRNPAMRDVLRKHFVTPSPEGQ